MPHRSVLAVSFAALLLLAAPMARTASGPDSRPATILLVGALTFLPALTLTPILEHFLMLNGKLF